MIYNLSQPNIEVNKRLEGVCFNAWLIFDWKTKQGFLSFLLGSKVTVSEKYSTKFGYDEENEILSKGQIQGALLVLF